MRQSLHSGPPPRHAHHPPHMLRTPTGPDARTHSPTHPPSTQLSLLLRMRRGFCKRNLQYIYIYYIYLYYIVIMILIEYYTLFWRNMPPADELIGVRTTRSIVEHDPFKFSLHCFQLKLDMFPSIGRQGLRLGNALNIIESSCISKRVSTPLVKPTRSIKWFQTSPTPPQRHEAINLPTMAGSSEKKKLKNCWILVTPLMNDTICP